MSDLRLRFAAATAGALAMLVSFASFANGGFPRDINNDLHLGYEPPCRLCHIQGTTGSGSVSEPFGISMLARGMTGSASSLQNALLALRTENIDSDGDGTPDITELVNGTDPNTPADVRLVGQEPTYGCAIRPTPRPTGIGEVLASVLVIAAALLRRRTARDRGQTVR